MKTWIYIAVIAVLLSAGCVTSLERNRAFSKGWAHQVHRERELEARKNYIKGNKGKGALVRTDAEGKPRFGLGKDGGLSADVGQGGGTLKYGIKW